MFNRKKKKARELKKRSRELSINSFNRNLDIAVRELNNEALPGEEKHFSFIKTPIYESDGDIFSDITIQITKNRMDDLAKYFKVPEKLIRKYDTSVITIKYQRDNSLLLPNKDYIKGKIYQFIYRNLV